MNLKYTMYKPNIYIIWYIECNSVFDKMVWGNIHGNVLSGTASLKDTLIKTKGKFP